MGQFIPFVLEIFDLGGQGQHVSGRVTHHLLKNLGCFCNVNHHLVEDVQKTFLPF